MNEKFAPAPKNSALATMAARFSVEPLKLLSTLKATVFKNATDDELLALVIVSNEYGLNPLTKEIYAFPAKGGGIVPVISIDGWINRMNNNAQFDGIEFDDVLDANGKPVKVTATIWRKDRERPIKVTEYFSECKRDTDPWRSMPCRMLRHKALSQCVRVAFGFGGVYDEDEATDIAIRDVTPAFPAPSPAAKAALTPSKNLKDKPAGRTETPPDAPEGTRQAPDAQDAAETGKAGRSIVTPEGGLFHMEQEPEPGIKPLTQAETLLERLGSNGVTEKRALEVCKKNRIPTGKTLAETDEKTLDIIERDFDAFVAESKK